MSAPTPERLLEFAFAYAPPLMIEAGVRQGLFDALANGPRPIEELTRASGCSSRGVRILLDALVALQLLAKTGPTTYCLTPESEAFLVSGRPGYQGGLFRHVSGQLLPPWLELSEVVHSGRPAVAINREGPGAAFFLQFVNDIYPLSAPAATLLAEHLEVASADSFSVLDLACGSGVWGITLAQASDRVRVTAVDWEGVLPLARANAERLGVSDRFSWVAADLLEAPLGSGHRLATLGHIVHSEGEERSRALFHRLYGVLAPGGTIAIAEWLRNDEHTGPPAAAIFAVNMLVNTEAGDTYSLEELRSWLEAAGFNDVRTLEAPGPSPLVLATRP
jgi:SAM-dependent methyltransferase